VFGVDEGRDSACALGFGDDVLRERGFTGGFWTIDLDDTTAWKTEYAERHVERKTSRWDGFDLHLTSFTETHDRTITELFFNLIDCSLHGERATIVLILRRFASHKVQKKKMFYLCSNRTWFVQ
jgi:hypothetical protein